MVIFNIGCIFFNILMFFVFLYDFKIDEKNIEYFFKGILYTGIIAVIWNVILYSSEILAILGIWIEDGLFLHGIKSFFSNRNAYAFFLFISIISNAFLLSKYHNKKRYYFYFIILLFGIWCSHSKTGFSLSVMFIELYLFKNSTFRLFKQTSSGLISLNNFFFI